MTPKEQMRREYLKMRQDMSAESCGDKSHRLIQSLVSLQVVQKADRIFSYSPIKNEVDLRELEKYALQIALPKVMNSSEMVFYHIDQDTVYKKSLYGIMEPCCGEVVVPNSKSVVLVPGSCFDLKGHRVGYGGGYYDRYLEKYPNVTKIGVCYSEQIADSIPSDDHDIRMSGVLTEDDYIIVT